MPALNGFPWAEIGWTFDPWIVTALVIVSFAVAREWMQRTRAGRPRQLRRTAMFGGAVIVLLIALVSPLHAAGETLFSLHMVQHSLLILVAAPLLARSRPAQLTGWTRKLRRGPYLGPPLLRISKTVRIWGRPGLVATAFVVVVAGWHLPVAYEWALHEPWAHRAEHISVTAAAVGFWTVVLRRLRVRDSGRAVAMVVAASMSMTALGALMTFSRLPWYPTHAQSAMTLGIDPVVDQQLAGLVMWMPGKIALAVTLLVAVRGIVTRRPRSPVVASTRRLPLLLVAVLVVGGCSAEPSRETGTDQVHWGEAISRWHCARCHDPDRSAPDLDSQALVQYANARELYDYTRRTMPLDEPGRLPDDDYWAVVAYLLARAEMLTLPEHVELGPDTARAERFLEETQ